MVDPVRLVLWRTDLNWLEMFLFVCILCIMKLKDHEDVSVLQYLCCFALWNVSED